MTIEFVRFKASDGVELQGWLSRQGGDTAVVHVHGMSGNGYENYFLDSFRDMYAARGITFLSMDNRGRGIISDFRQGDGWKRAGSCFEIFEESVYDIEGALGYLEAQGYSRFILQGHSLGCSKIVNYVVSSEPGNVEKLVLLAPTDMVAWASEDPERVQNLAKAKRLLAEDRGEELVGAQCWPLDKTPLSAQAYLSKSDAGGPVDIYGPGSDGVSPLGRLNLSILIPYGTQDIGVTYPFGSMDAFRSRLERMNLPNAELAVIDGADHGFRGFEDELTGIVERFIGMS